MHSQRSFVTCGEAFVQRVYLQPDDRVMVVLPLFHINALFYSLAGTLAAGCSALIVQRFSASTFWQTARRPRRHRSQHHRGDRHHPQEPAAQRVPRRAQNTQGLRRARRASPDAFRDEFGIPHCIGGYGMTEIPGVTCNPVRRPAEAGQHGADRAPSRSGAAVGASAAWSTTKGRDVGADETGELWVKTPIIMQGYFRDPEQTPGRVPRRLVQDRRSGAARRRRLLLFRFAQEGHHPPPRREHRRRGTRPRDRRASRRCTKRRRSPCRRNSARTRSWSPSSRSPARR